jgi:predicted O-methyltransferase YrrM
MVIKDLEDYAKEYNIPIMLPDGIEFLVNYIKDNNIKNILEIGSAIGYSAIRMALVDSNIIIDTIERDQTRYNEAIKNIKAFDLDKQINIYNIDAFDYETNNQYDLIFIDAAKSQYIKFFEKFSNNLKPEGVIITDNLSFHGLVDNPELTHNRNTKQLVKKIKKYISYLENNTNYNTEFIKTGDGIAISKKKN